MMMPNLTARQTRAQDSELLAQCSWKSLKGGLPFLWPTPAGVPASPKRKYRSWYTYPGYEKLANLAVWEELPLFELLLHLVDFSGLRPVLSQQLGWTTAQGQVPFDPVSLFLLVGWQLSNSWNRAEMLKNIAGSRYADLAHYFGFRDSVYPTEGGIRYFLTTLGQTCSERSRRNSSDHNQAIALAEDKAMTVAYQQLNQLIVQSVHLLLDAGIITPEAWHKANLCPDGMLHKAASRLRCAHVRDSCYQVTTPDQPRPCPAQDKGRQGCACDTVACVSTCRSATPRDAEARFVFNKGHNQPDTSPNKASDPAKQSKGRGRAVYGYRSLPLLLVEPQRRFSVILATDFRPANEPEPPPVAALLKQLPTLYPSLNVEVVAGDAAFGTDQILSIVYHDLHARRVIDLRGHQTDQDPHNWLLRGYDHKGRPLCPFGYRLIANGYDAHRQRRKYFCNRSCCQDTVPVVPLDAIPQPPTDCPYLSSDSSRGLILNVADTFPDGSSRLVRDVLVDSPMWKALYHRPRNASEGRNAALEKWGLKRLSVYGQSRGQATIMLADVWLNLSTLARIVREATLAVPP
jgi:hypothetical protein